MNPLVPVGFDYCVVYDGADYIDPVTNLNGEAGHPNPGYATDLWSTIRWFPRADHASLFSGVVAKPPTYSDDLSGRSPLAAAAASGDHFLAGKFLSYEQSIRVPLLMEGPGIPAGVVASNLVSNLDWAVGFGIPDDDADGHVDLQDNCAEVSNPDQRDRTPTATETSAMATSTTMVRWAAPTSPPSSRPTRNCKVIRATTPSST